MQKVLRINTLARNQAVRKTRRQGLKDLKQEWYDHDQRKILHRRAELDQVRAERKARREDWMLGPLAPKRDVGLKQGVYGTMDHVQLKGPGLPAAVRKGPKSSGGDIEGREGLEGEGKRREGEGN
jgi:large subunit ribosomal protein L24